MIRAVGPATDVDSTPIFDLIVSIDVDKEPFSIKKLAINYLCLYAVLYPLIAHFLMNGEGTGGVGSAPVQALQFLTLVACFCVGKLGKASVRESLDVWTVGSLYFACASLYLAVFFAEEERFVEITYAARFITWFLFAAIVARGSFGIEQLSRLAGSFLIGAFLQGTLAIWAFKTRSVGSIYNEVYATTGGAYVSGKMIVSFVTLGVFLAAYWFFTKKRLRWAYIVSILVGLLVILFSYNRATQLSLSIVVMLGGVWLIRNKKVKAVFLLAMLFVVFAAFLSSSVGNSFLLRWQNIQEDGGSGRVKLVRAAVENLVDPDSLLTLIFGIGYHQTKLLMYQACGAYIGTHSDFFDFLTVYGLVGGVFYVGIVRKILALGNGLPRLSLERLCIRSSALFIILTGLCTGLFQGTYTFFMLFTLCRYWYERGRFPAYLPERSRLSRRSRGFFAPNVPNSRDCEFVFRDSSGYDECEETPLDEEPDSDETPAYDFQTSSMDAVDRESNFGLLRNQEGEKKELESTCNDADVSTDSEPIRTFITASIPDVETSENDSVAGIEAISFQLPTETNHDCRPEEADNAKLRSWFNCLDEVYCQQGSNGLDDSADV